MVALPSARLGSVGIVASWSEHLRQHERVTVRDRKRLDAVRALTDPGQPTWVTHWVTPQPELDAGAKEGS